ncbi:MAG TPA: energy-coupling factor transporter transmembrane protein EcfT [Nitrososphaeria archaeon]|nr:energy-coupling factor transporter transmembrane protein EcfT [Nitrososphaeria archaeon]
MATILQGLQFYPGDSLIHKLDPRAKLLISMSFLLITLIYVEVTVTTIIIVAEALLAAASGTIRRWIKTVYGSIPFILAVFLMNYLVRMFIPGQPPIHIILYESFAAAYRLIALLASFSIFFLTTTPEEIGMTLTKLKIPYMYVFAFISAIRFTPILAEELQTIMDSQRSRGLELDKGNPLTRLRRYIPILVPLIVNVLRRSYELAEAMEVKCFGASKKRTYLKELKLRPKDLIVIILTLISISISIYFKFINPIKIP